MKTSLLKSVVLSVLVLAGTLTSGVYAQDNLVRNDVMNGDLVVSTTVYKNEGSLVNHLKYDYKYDGEKRITEKEAFKWDSRKSEWKPYYKISYTYTDDSIVMDYGKWNAKDKSYSLDKERTVYQVDEFSMPVSYEKMKMNENGTSWIIVDNAQYENIDKLYAEKKQ